MMRLPTLVTVAGCAVGRQVAAARGITGAIAAGGMLSKIIEVKEGEPAKAAFAFQVK